MNNLDKLKEAFSRGLNIELSAINESLAYQKNPKWDSISHMVLISEIESEFDISIETDDVIDISSFGKAKEIMTKYSINF
ncbi:MAG: acyl carrier protein [Bacteroidota bacterium]